MSKPIKQNLSERLFIKKLVKSLLTKGILNKKFNKYVINEDKVFDKESIQLFNKINSSGFIITSENLKDLTNGKMTEEQIQSTRKTLKESIEYLLNKQY
jgi:hypothetical protein